MILVKTIRRISFGSGMKRESHWQDIFCSYTALMAAMISLQHAGVCGWHSRQRKIDIGSNQIFSLSFLLYVHNKEITCVCHCCHHHQKSILWKCKKFLIRIEIFSLDRRLSLGSFPHTKVLLHVSIFLLPCFAFTTHNFYSHHLLVMPIT